MIVSSTLHASPPLLSLNWMHLSVSFYFQLVFNLFIYIIYPVFDFLSVYLFQTLICLFSFVNDVLKLRIGGVGGNINHEPCTIMCNLAMGMIPQLQCVKCLCLYHHECVGLNRKDGEYRMITSGSSNGCGKDYICEVQHINFIIIKTNVFYKMEYFCI